MQTINYLNLISFSDFSNWSVRYLLETKNSYNEKYDFVKIGSFLRRNKTNINIENNVTYKRVTVKINNNGVYLRDTEKGINIGTKKQFLAQKGNYIISKIDARNGAFGIIPEELNNAIVTNDFPLFYVDETRININFLLLITTTKEFIKFAQSCSSGTTNRQRMDIDLFLEQKIPLPTIEEQKRIIGNYNTKLELAKQQEEQAKILEIEIEKYLFEELGIEHKKDSYEKIIGSFLKIYKYSKFDKWGANQNNSNKIISNNSFELRKIKDICTVSSGGTPSRERKEYYKGNIPWIKTGEVVNGIIYDTEEKITKEAIENSSAKIYPKDSLIIAMYGQGATRGRTAKLGIDASTNQACAVLFNIDNSVILTDYLWLYLMGEYDRMREMASGNNQPNLNAQMLKDYNVIIPPFEIQNKIIETINSIKKQIKELNALSAENKVSAVVEFENEIFN